MRALRHPRHAAPKVNAAGRPYAAPNVGFWANSGQSWILASCGYDANDPKRTYGFQARQSRRRLACAKRMCP
jgi:hypothetical protein